MTKLSSQGRPDDKIVMLGAIRRMERPARGAARAPGPAARPAFDCLFLARPAPRMYADRYRERIHQPPAAECPWENEWRRRLDRDRPRRGRRAQRGAAAAGAAAAVGVA